MNQRTPSDPANRSKSMSRSTHGCWTCRVRHKKCDETHPLCNVCTTRSIACYGYGEKPEWLDGGRLEKQYRKDIKKAVKKNFKQLKRKTPASSKPKDTAQQHEALNDPDRGSHRKHSNASTSPVSEYALDDTSHVTTACRVSLNRAVLAESSLPPQSTTVSSPQDNVSLSRNILDYRNAELLMHYFDYVFPLQFRFYTKDPDKAGRGWLLWLLVKTGPLYQATLSLAALHRYTLRNHDLSEKYAELDDYHSKALRDLQLFLQENQEANSLGETSNQIEVLACGVSLISFELFRGGVSDWQLHLTALTSILHDVNTSDVRLHQNQHITARPREPSSNTETAAFPFLVAVILWFDVLSCASTGRAPHLSYEALMQNQRVSLENVMGCQNWAMITIGDIATLNVWKKHQQLTNASNIRELLKRSQRIERRLEQGLATIEHQSGFEIAGRRPRFPAGEFGISARLKVTRAFACAALVQLHTIVHGAHPGRAEVQTSVQRTIGALEQIHEHQDLRGLIWPICISGCMADLNQQPFFEHLINMIVGQNSQDFGNSTTALRIMQKCWAMRLLDPSQEWDWERAMTEMDICGLLV